jgi:hypothetical protein
MFATPFLRTYFTSKSYLKDLVDYDEVGKIVVNEFYNILKEIEGKDLEKNFIEPFSFLEVITNHTLGF